MAPSTPDERPESGSQTEVSDFHDADDDGVSVVEARSDASEDVVSVLEAASALSSECPSLDDFSPTSYRRTRRYADLEEDVADGEEMVRTTTKGSRVSSRISVSTAPSISPEMQQRLDDDLAIQEEFVTEVKTPPWIGMLLAATGISDFQYKIEKERERRADSYFVHPFPMVQLVVRNNQFEVMVALSIVVNCMLIGLEASIEEGALETVFNVGEHFFVAFFFVEWCMRVLAFGWVWIFELLNFFDTILVFGTGVLLKWVMEPLGSDIRFLRIFTVLRTLRLVRLTRAVRLVPFFKDLWILMNGLVDSTQPLLWCVVIGMIILYTFAVVGTELIGRREVFQDDDYVQTRFGDLPRSTLTLFQVMTLDDWGGDVARPMMKQDNLLSLFFISFISVTVFIFWNLITTILIQKALTMKKSDTSHQEKEVAKQKQQQLKELAELFTDLDKDGSGELDRKEFLAALGHRRVQQVLSSMGMDASELRDAWGILDTGGGLLTVAEFADGLRRMKGRAKPMDLIDMVKRLRHTALGHAELQAQVDQFDSSLEGLEVDVKRMAIDTGEVVSLFQEMYHRLQVHIERSAREDKAAVRLAEKKAKEQERKELQAEVDAEEDFE